MSATGCGVPGIKELELKVACWNHLKFITFFARAGSCKMCG